MATKNELLWGLIVKNNQPVTKHEKPVLELYKKGRSSTSEGVHEATKLILMETGFTSEYYRSLREGLKIKLRIALRNEYPETHEKAMREVFPPLKEEGAEKVFAILEGSIIFNGEIILIADKYFQKDLYNTLPSHLLQLAIEYKTFKQLNKKNFNVVCKKCGLTSSTMRAELKKFLSDYSK